MKIHILTAALLAALTALPSAQAQTKTAGNGVSGTPSANVPPVSSRVSPRPSVSAPLVLTVDQAHFLSDAIAARGEYEELTKIRDGAAKSAIAKILPGLEVAYFKKYLNEIGDLYLISPDEANKCVILYKNALTREASPLKPLEGIPPPVELYYAYDFNFYVWAFATEEEITTTLKVVPREYIKARRGKKWGHWNSAELHALFQAAQRINTPEIWDYVRSQQCGHGVLDAKFIEWINDYSKGLEVPDAIKLLNREIQVLSLSPKSTRRDEVLTQHLTALSLLKQLTPQPVTK